MADGTVNIGTLREKCFTFNERVGESQEPVNSFGELADQGSSRYLEAATKLGEVVALLGGFKEIREAAGQRRQTIGEKVGAALDLASDKEDGIGFASATRVESVRTVPERTSGLTAHADTIHNSFLQSAEAADAFISAINGIKDGLEKEGERLPGSLQEPTGKYNGSASQIIADVAEYARNM